MRKLLINKLSFFVYLIVFSGYAQIKNDVLKQVLKKYEGTGPLEFAMTYNLYKDYKTKVVNETYSGCFIKKDVDRAYMKINNTEFFQFRNHAVQISHDENIIVVSTIANATKPQHDIATLLKDYDFTDMVDKKQYWQLKLKTKEGAGTPYSYVIIDISKDYTIKKETFFYSSGINFSKDYTTPDISNPRLEIVFGKFNTQITNKVTSLDQIYTIKNNKIIAAVKYKNYEIIDNRKTN